MNKTFWISLLLVTTMVIQTAQAVQQTKGMTKKEIQAKLEEAVLDFQYECYWQCGGNSIPVTKGADGQYRISGGQIIKESAVYCYGKKPSDKVARAQRTADEAKAGNKKAQDTANSAKTISKKAQDTANDAKATAEEAMARLNADKTACLDSIFALRRELTFVSSQYTELNSSYSNLSIDFGNLRQNMPPDQSEAISELNGQVSELKETDQKLTAFARKTHKNPWEKIELRAAELKALEKPGDADSLDIDPPSPSVVKPHRKWWQKR